MVILQPLEEHAGTSNADNGLNVQNSRLPFNFNYLSTSGFPVSRLLYFFGKTDTKVKTTDKIKRESTGDRFEAGYLVNNIYRFNRPAAFKKKPDAAPVQMSQLRDFFYLLENDTICQFLGFDTCRIYADSYLLAMVFTYFVRAGYTEKEYNTTNFFAALMLAHDVEEDLENMKMELVPWALGPKWKVNFANLFKVRDQLFTRIDYRALVSRKCCQQVIDLFPEHWAWKRQRPLHHSGAIYDHHLSDEELTQNWKPRGPHRSPRRCIECEQQLYDLNRSESTTGACKLKLSLSKRQRETPSDEENNWKFRG